MTAIETINQFFEAIIAKDAAKVGTFYIQDENTYVVLEGPRLTTLGFSKIQKGWVDFCASTLRLAKIEWLEGAFSEEELTMAWVGGVIRLTIAIGEKEFTQTFRASFVVKRPSKDATMHQEHTWLIRHEHVSGALTDPYGIGDWLKK